MQAGSDDAKREVMKARLNMPPEWKKILTREGLQHYGLAQLEKPFSIDVYKKWLQKGWHGNMQYLEKHLPQKQQPQHIKQDHFFTHALVVGCKYVPHPKEQKIFKHLQVALYAQGEDYHHFFRKKLQFVADQLKLIEPEAKFLAMTDSQPVLERDLAYRAGLGWVGKNTCLIHPQQGSLFFIGEIYIGNCSRLKPVLKPPQFETIYQSQQKQKQTRKPAALGQGMHDMCGKCTRCIDACPTGALVGPRQLDARKCISYLTIEAHRLLKAKQPQQWGKTKTLPTESQQMSSQRGALDTNIKQWDIQSQSSAWFFGCDICQTVCPWNKKTLFAAAKTPQRNITIATPKLNQRTNSKKNKNLQNSTSHLNTSEPFGTAGMEREISMILELSNKKLTKLVAATPLSRAGAVGLKKNVIMVAVHFKLTQLGPQIANYTQHPRLGPLATWATKQLL